MKFVLVLVMPAVEVVEGTNLNKEEIAAPLYVTNGRVELAFEDLRFEIFYRWGRILKMLKSVCRKTSHSMALGVVSRG